VGGWIADESTDRISEAEGVTYNYPEDADYSCGYHAFDHGGDNVFTVYHTAIEEGETGSHKENECGGNQYPGDVCGIVLRGIGEGGGVRNKKGADGDEKEYNKGGVLLDNGIRHTNNEII